MASKLPRLPEYVPSVPPAYVPPTQSLTRPTARQINRATSDVRETTLTLAGFGQVIPVTYGEDRVSGIYLVSPRIHNSRFLCAILWGWGEIEGVQAMYINGAPVPGIVTLTHYVGTDAQTPDPTLTAAIPGFADAYKGLAYTVVSIPAGAITGFPGQARIEAVIRGRKLLDPRTSTVAWSANPGLAIYDWVTSERYGPSRYRPLPITGAEAVADRCDSLVGGVEVRSEIGYTLASPIDLPSTMSLLSAYAECLWTYDGDGILIVPDAPVMGEIPVISRDDIVEGTFRPTTEDLSFSPTEVTIRYRVSSGTAEQWPEAVEPQRLPGVDAGEVAAITSEVHLPGTRRASEAARKALTRLRRLQHPGRYAWQMFDVGVFFQLGDVVQLPDTRGMVDEQVRILSTEMVAPGIYQFTAEKYDPANYPDDYVPGSEVPVPVGGILPFSGSEIPAGYEAFSDADDRYILGASSSIPAGSIGGSNVVGAWTGSVADGAHSGSQNLLIYGNRGTEWSSFFDAVQFPIPGGNTPPRQGSHTHNLSISASSTILAPGRRTRWIRRIGIPGRIPRDAEILSDGAIISPALTAVTQNLGRLMMSGSTLSNVGNNGSAPVTVSSQSSFHYHGGRFYKRVLDGPISGPYMVTYEFAPHSANHNHGGSTSGFYIDPNPRRRQLAAFMATTPADIVPGCIIGFDPAYPIPPGWRLCDGTEGTPDLSGRYLERSSIGDAGRAFGDNTITFFFSTSTDDPHTHAGQSRGTHRPYTSWWHGNFEGHSHSFSATVSFMPSYYAMQFIQYTGAE